MSTRRPSSACQSFQASQYSRRAMLRVGGMGMLGLTLPKLLQGASATAKPPAFTGKLQPMVPLTPITPRAKSVIFLYQFGGPSHLDMFDMKPDAPEVVR